MNGTQTRGKRLTESRMGSAIAWLLCIIWLISIPVADGHASSFFLIGWGLSAVVLLAGIAIISGHKIVRLSLTGWLGIGIGLYFLIRSIYSTSLVDSWYETGLLMGAFVFYMAGIYSAQASKTRVLIAAIVLCVILNTIALYLMNSTGTDIRILGRPEVCLAGENSRNTSLFVYKNFAGLAFALSGALLIWYTIWRAKADATAIALCIVGVAGLSYSICCNTRVIWLAIPVVCVVSTAIWVTQTIIKKKNLSSLQIALMALLLTGLFSFAVDCFMGGRIFDSIFGVDSHLRFKIWAEAWRNVGNAPLNGYGSAAAQWIISPTYNDLHLPNYVHNEYLQAWLDYGIIGIGLMLGFILLHVMHGICVLASEHITEERWRKTALALNCLVCLAAAAFTDFAWHNFSLVALTAFSCGILASPYPHAPIRLFDFRNWAPESRPHARPLRAEAGARKYVILTLFISSALMLAKHCLTIYPGWSAQWEYDQLVETGATNEQRRQFLLGAVQHYPHSKIADHYALLGNGNMYWNRYEQMLRCILNHNPRQIFTAAMLADTLGRQQRFGEAEIIFRRYYPNDGPDNSVLNTWATHYATNLFAWAEQMIANDKREVALSMMLCADKIMKSGPRPLSVPSFRHRKGARCWVDGGSLHRRTFIANCRTDLTILQTIGTKPDHSWKAPLEPGGKPALYSRYFPNEN